MVAARVHRQGVRVSFQGELSLMKQFVIVDGGGLAGLVGNLFLRSV